MTPKAHPMRCMKVVYANTNDDLVGAMNTLQTLYRKHPYYCTTGFTHIVRRALPTDTARRPA